jgi:DNA-binding CsgD family transcriptional regulator
VHVAAELFNTAESQNFKGEIMPNLKLIHLDSRTFSPSAERYSFGRHTGRQDAIPTPRELEVEDLLCRGYSQENIAAILGRSINTISVHALSLYRKRRVHSQVGLLLAYLERKGIFVFPQEGSDRALNERTSLEANQ